MGYHYESSKGLVAMYANFPAVNAGKNNQRCDTGYGWFSDFTEPTLLCLNQNQITKSEKRFFSKHVVFDKMLETLVKGRVFCVSTSLFAPLCSTTFSVLQANSFSKSAYLPLSSREKRKSTPTRRAFWQALLRPIDLNLNQMWWQQTTLIFPLPVYSLLSNKQRATSLSSILK